MDRCQLLSFLPHVDEMPSIIPLSADVNVSGGGTSPSKDDATPIVVVIPGLTSDSASVVSFIFILSHAIFISSHPNIIVFVVTIEILSNPLLLGKCRFMFKNLSSSQTHGCGQDSFLIRNCLVFLMKLKSTMT